MGLWTLWALVSGLLSAVFHLDPLASSLVYGVGALAFGFEADRLKEISLMNKGLLLQGLSLGENVREAETLYFERHATGVAEEVPISIQARPALPFETPDLLGLFPSQEDKL